MSKRVSTNRCMHVGMSERCNCTEPKIVPRADAEGWDYCQCGHTIACHDMSPAERRELPRPVVKAKHKKVAPKPVEAVTETPEPVGDVLDAKQMRDILRANGIDVKERGRIDAASKIKAYELAGKAVPSDLSAKPASVAAVKVTPAAYVGSLTVPEARDILAKNGHKPGKRGRLSGDQMRQAEAIKNSTKEN